MQAAFFDLDKTIIARAALVAFSRPLHRAGYLSRWLVLRALYGQFVFHYLGADDDRMAQMRESALRVTKGWPQAHIRELVEQTLDEVIDPIIYAEALDLIREHRAAGRRVYVVSASPEEVVAPLARHLGADQAIATRARLDEDGRYTGDVEFYAFGPFKAQAMRDEAERLGIDLSVSYAYTDSATDLPMLEAVGNPVAVNPDRELLKAATEHGWEIRVFERPISMRSRRPVPIRAAAGIGGGAVVATGVAGLALWWLLRDRAPANGLVGRSVQVRGWFRRPAASWTPQRRGR
ncbi:MAG: HAD-IB family hydrolase [Acidimicrobiales bacterium]|nr:HAD-IB family hydrolase [Acidimicrobiales bacterium]